ncbi:MAG: hypothetical protein H7X86_04820 [Gorillibacterium sp.]|nr:hypothetical protein [Gorillibacterium sp.]
MKWIFCSILCWTILILVIDRKRFKKLFFSGLLAMTAQVLFDGLAIRQELYQIVDPVISIFGSSLFFSVGVVLPMGILVAQFTTRSRKYQVLNIIAWTFLFTLFEYLSVYFNMMKHIHWSMQLSIVFNTMIMVVLTWFAEHFLFPKKTERGNSS